ncbi:alpha/beta hydrolase [Paracoccaceae bacterium]|nr:alpha/beta hydrolase [Paracoccaceae bacterium]
MTSSDKNLPSIDLQLNANLQKLEELSGRFFEVLNNKKQINLGLNGPGHDLFVKTAGAYLKSMAQNPTFFMEQQISYWGKTLEYFAETQEQFFSNSAENENIEHVDKRFKHQLWKTNPFYKNVLKQYHVNSDMITEAVAQVEGLSSKDQARLEYFSSQIIDMMAPTNFFGTNPDALEKAFLSKGESLVKGLENLIRDLESNNGELLVRLADETAFKVGSDLAATPGKVVFRNRLFELIQYSPSTEMVYQTPLLIFPPWINKFYILDLKPHNSLIRWIVDQGYTLFVVSWVNPDTSYADVGLEEYIEEGYFEAIEQVKSICNTKTINALGYCIAGTVLSIVMSLIKKRGDTSINTATLLTTLTDFSDQREFTPFLQNDFIDTIESEIKSKGILESFIIARTFSFLRSNDLIYNPAIKSYMMGESPPSFDLLFWNGDGSNLPGKMALQYLRNLCQDNQFAKNQFKMFGEILGASDIETPVFAVSCETDHIASWEDSFRGLNNFSSKEKTFVLSEAGHVAGIVNAPGRGKYGYYFGEADFKNPENWKQRADFEKESWWPFWEKWLGGRSKELVKARTPGMLDDVDLGNAPGSYVHKKS